MEEEKTGKDSPYQSIPIHYYRLLPSPSLLLPSVRLCGERDETLSVNPISSQWQILYLVRRLKTGSPFLSSMVAKMTPRPATGRRPPPLALLLVVAIWKPLDGLMVTDKSDSSGNKATLE